MSSATESRAEVFVAPGESIQEALDGLGPSAPGTVVRLGEGVYEGSLSLPSGVRLAGVGSTKTVIVPGPVAATTVPPLHDAPADVVSGIALHECGDVTVEGLAVRGFSGAGIYAHTCTGVRLTDVSTEDNQVWGVYLRESSDLRVDGCVARGSQYGGITFAFCPRAEAIVTGSEASGCAFGIFVDNSRHVRVVRSRCHGNAAGILLLHQTYEGELPGGVSDCLIADNDLVDNTLASGGDDPEALGAAGPPISGVGLAAVGVQRIAVVGNRVHGNRPSGPSVMGSALMVASSADWGGSDSVDNDFEWNTVTGNEPCDVVVGTDPAGQRFRNNVVGTSYPDPLDGPGTQDGPGDPEPERTA